MDIKEINKGHLTYLSVYLRFTTSLATGNTIVSVFKQTIEKIEQVEGKTTVQTVIVKEEDLVVDDIAKNKSAIFAVSKEILDVDGKTIEVSAGRGFAVSVDGIVAVDANLVPDKGVYYVKNDSGKFKADFMSLDKAGFSFLKIGASLDEKNKLVFTVPVFGDMEKMKIGQKVLLLGKTISSSIFEGNKNVNINVAKSNAGGLVLNLDGEALGIALFGDTTNFASIGAITEALKSTETVIPKTP